MSPGTTASWWWTGGTIGCKAAYNLDGGQTSLLAKGTKLVNRPSGGGRGASDFIVVIDEVVD